jgi:hypothetical protein
MTSRALRLVTQGEHIPAPAFANDQEKVNRIRTAVHLFVMNTLTNAQLIDDPKVRGTVKAFSPLIKFQVEHMSPEDALKLYEVAKNFCASVEEIK